MIVVRAFFVALGLVVVWQAIIVVFSPPSFMLPSPLSVFEALRDRPSLWQVDAVTTATETVIGLIAGTALGVMLALLMSFIPQTKRMLLPMMVVSQALPVFAIAPLLVLWFGAGYKAVTISAFIASLFPVVANTLTGLLSTDRDLRDMFRLYNAGPVATLWKLKLPSATPNIVTGLRIASGLAVIGAIVGEFVAGEAHGAQGLGLAVLVAINRFRTPLVFANVLAASLLGLALFAAVHFLGYLLLRRWHGASRER